jgi:hypothetical protein
MKYLIALTMLFLTVPVQGQQITGMDGRKSQAVVVQRDSDGVTYIAEDDIDLIHDQTCWAMNEIPGCPLKWLNSRFEFKVQTILTTPDAYGTKTVVSLYLADTAQAKLIKEVATGFDANGKVIWHRDHRSYYDMDFILTEPSSKDQLKLVISVCDLLEAQNPGRVGKDVQYLYDHQPRP